MRVFHRLLVCVCFALGGFEALGQVTFHNNSGGTATFKWVAYYTSAYNTVDYQGSQTVLNGSTWTAGTSNSDYWFFYGEAGATGGLGSKAGYDAASGNKLTQHPGTTGDLYWNGAGPMQTNSVACVTWTNTGPTWAMLQVLAIDSAGNAYDFGMLADSSWAAVAVPPGKSWSRCITNTIPSLAGNPWCGGAAGWVVGDMREGKTVADVSGTFNCTTVPFTSTNAVSSTSTNLNANIYDAVGTNAVISHGTNLATSADINQLGNVDLQAAAAVERAVRDLQKQMSNGIALSGGGGTNVSDYLTHLKLDVLAAYDAAIMTNTLLTASGLGTVANLLTNLQNLEAAMGTNVVGIATNTAGISTNLLGLSTNVGGLATNIGKMWGIISNLWGYGTNLAATGTNTDWEGLTNGTALGTATNIAYGWYGTNLEGYEGVASGLSASSPVGITGDGADWGYYPIGWGSVAIDLKNIFNGSVLENPDSVFGGGYGLHMRFRRGAEASMKIAASGLAGLSFRAVLRAMIVWGLVVGFVLMLANEIRRVVIELASVPSIARADPTVLGNSLLGEGELSKLARWALFLAVAALFPAIMVAVLDTVLALVSSSPAGLSSYLGGGGMSSLAGASGIGTAVGRLWVELNSWLPLTEFFVIATNVGIATIVANLMAVKLAILEKTMI